MPEKEIIKLSDLQEEIKNTLLGKFNRPLWIVAEVSELKENISGHCYLDLVEKDENSDNLLARARATIWASAYRMLKPYFETATGYRMGPGIKIMVAAGIEYHPVYGLSLNIKDIDPNYTLGDVARRRQEIIRKLEADGVIEMNKETVLPVVPQKIAVISSETAAGYEDFLDQLINNPYGYKFYVKLFPSTMQGEKAESGIISSLEAIYHFEDLFDLVVIIRGGGSKSDLSCFDSYDLAYHVSQFPIPVLTGIGHEQDDTITDLVAHTRLKTPTAVAGFLIDQLAEFEGALNGYSENLVDSIQGILHEKRIQINTNSQLIISGTRAFMAGKTEKAVRMSSRARHVIIKNLGIQRNKLLRHGESLKNNARNYPKARKTEIIHHNTALKQGVNSLLQKEKQKHAHFNKLATYVDPSQILKLGFSVTRHEGAAVKDPSKLEKGDMVETVLHRGKIDSKVTDIEKKNLYISNPKERSG